MGDRSGESGGPWPTKTEQAKDAGSVHALTAWTRLRTPACDGLQPARGCHDLPERSPKYLHQDFEGVVDIGLADDERRGETKDVRAGGEAHEAGIERCVDDLLCGPVELGAHEQAVTACVRDSRKRGEAGEEPRAVRAHGGEQRVVDGRADRDGSGARDGVAAERRAVVAGGERGRRV